MTRYYLNEGFKLSEYGLKLEEKFRLVEEDTDINKILTDGINAALKKVDTLTKTVETITKVNFEERQKKAKELEDLIDQADIAADPAQKKAKAEQYTTSVKEIIGGDNRLNLYPTVKALFADLIKLANKPKLTKAEETDIVNKLKLIQTEIINNKDILAADSPKRKTAVDTLKDTTNTLNILLKNTNYTQERIKDAINFRNAINTFYKELPSGTALRNAGQAEWENNYNKIIEVCNAFNTDANVKTILDKAAADKVAVDEAEAKKAADEKIAKKSAEIQAANSVDSYWKTRLSSNDDKAALDDYCKYCWSDDFKKIIGPGLLQDLIKLGFTPATNPFIIFLEYAFGVTHDWATTEYKEETGADGKLQKIFPGRRTNTGSTKLSNLNEPNKYNSIHNAYAKDLISKTSLNANSTEAKTSIIYCNGLYKMSGADIYEILKLRNTVHKKYSSGSYTWTGDKQYLNNKFGSNENNLVKAIFIDGDLASTQLNLDTQNSGDKFATLRLITSLVNTVFDTSDEKVTVNTDSINKLLGMSLFDNEKNVIAGILYTAIQTDNAELAQSYDKVKTNPQINLLDGDIKKVTAQINKLDLDKTSGANLIKAFAKKLKD